MNLLSEADDKGESCMCMLQASETASTLMSEGRTLSLICRQWDFTV